MIANTISKNKSHNPRTIIKGAKITSHEQVTIPANLAPSKKAVKATANHTNNFISSPT